MATFICPRCGKENALADGISLDADTLLDCLFCKAPLAVTLLTLDQIMVLTRAIDWMKEKREDDALEEPADAVRYH